MSPAKPRRVAPGARERGPIGSAAVFTGLLLLGLAGAFWLAPAADVALAAGAAWIVFLLLVVAAWDLLALRARRFARYLAWLPTWPLAGWMDPLRSSFIAVSFFYGILVGHFFWR